MLFFRYLAYGSVYLDYFKDLKKLSLIEILFNKREYYIFLRYKIYGIEYLNFIKEGIDKDIKDIIDTRDLQDGYSMSIMDFIFFDTEDKRRN